MNEGLLIAVVNAAATLVVAYKGEVEQPDCVVEANRFLKELFGGYSFKRDDSNNPDKWRKV